jgi:hypothetical protein
MVFVIKSFYLNRQLVRSSEKYGCRDIVPAKLQTKLKKQKLQKKFPWIRNSFSCLKIFKPAIEQVVSEF